MFVFVVVLIKSFIGEYMPVVLIATGIATGIVATMLVRHCDIDAAMRPLVYVINELSGGCR